ncbi:MAG: Outer rane efflux protein [Pseudomonadota bacterium]|jgi:adhesin transport system outer membrane protein
MKNRTFKISNLLVLVASSLGFSAYSNDGLREDVLEVLKSNPRVQAAQADHASAQARESEIRRRLWRPNADFTAEMGVQQYSTESITSPWRDVDRVVLRGTQLLYDFGRSDRQVNEFTSVAAQAGAVAGATTDGVLLEALTAHWSAVRARLVLDFARRSESSVRDLTRTESSLVELGKGYESDVLQSKIQLAGAEARRIRAEGALDIAEARLKVFFGPVTARLNFDQVAVPVQSKLPASLQEAQDAALLRNKQLQVGAHRSKALTQRLAFTELKETRPKFELIAETGQRRNWDSAIDGARVYDKKVLLQLNWNFNAWRAASDADEAVRQDLTASVQREAEARSLVIEQVAIAWRNLLVARQNQQTLANQVRIAAKYFEMVTAERQLGRRSLMDVLTAEVSLINAISDLVSTEVDGSLAALTLLQVTGLLDLEAVAISEVNKELPGAAIPR